MNFGGELARMERQSQIRHLIERYQAKSIIFLAVKDQTPKGATPPQVLVWRKYQTLGCRQNIDIPKNILVTSSESTKDGKAKFNHFALVCNTAVPIRAGNTARDFANSHYKNLMKAGKGYELGSNQRGQRTTSPLVKWTSHPVTANDCNSAIQFSAHFAAPDCVELHDSKRVPYAQILALNAINNVEQWLAAVAAIRR